MAMTQQQLDALVARLEKFALRHPLLYKLRLGALATFGYLYILTVIVLLLVTAGAVLFFFDNALAIVLLALVAVALKSLWVRIEPPTGLALTRRDYPALFDAIEEARAAAQAPRPHVVLLTNDENAAIGQVPRFGIFGWRKTYLILGLPLLQLSSLDEFRAVLAHEFGHLSCAHGRFGAWIFRLRTSWALLAKTLRARRQRGSFLFLPFFEWFAPTFKAYSFVHARMREYEADRAAAARHGAQSLVNSLIRMWLKKLDLAKSYWPSVYKAADDSPTPTGTPYRGLLGPELRGFLPTAPEQLRTELEVKTGTADTHPCLRDRIAALNVPGDMPPPLGTTAAVALLGDHLGTLVDYFDAEWRKNVSDSWTKRHKYVQAGRQKLAELDAKPSNEISDDELFAHGKLAAEFAGFKQAADIFRKLVDRGTNYSVASFALAHMRLLQGDEGGLAAFEEDMAQHPGAVMPACRLIVDYLRSQGRYEDAKPYIERYKAARGRRREQRRERFAVRVTDEYEPHSLRAESLLELEHELGNRGDIKAAYLVRKKVAPGEPPVHVVGVKRRSGLFGFEKAAADAALIKTLEDEILMDEDLVWISVNGKHKRFAKIFKNVRRSRIKLRGEPAARRSR
jgi:Zn-dependent protease with chaperone function